MIAYSCTNLLLYFSSFAFIPIAVNLLSISYSCYSLSSQYFKSRETDIGTRLSVGL
jgi:hypothetical protein